MEFEILAPGPYPVPQLLDENYILKLLPAATYDSFDRTGLRLFCHNYARYGLPTVELIDWLKNIIGSRSCIEIGSGSGDLAYHLGIKATDNRMQEWGNIKVMYNLSNQPRIRYPYWVEELDAIDAVQRYKPEVVLASWVTEWIDPDRPVPPHGGNMFGVKEHLIISAGDVGLSDKNPTYILIGNDSTHGKKRIMSQEHKTYNLPFLRSRAKYPELDRVYIWEPVT